MALPYGYVRVGARCPARGARGTTLRWIQRRLANTDATAFALDLLHSHKVAVAPGETFGPGGAGLVRVALCASEEAIARGLGTLIEVVQSAR